VERSGPDDARDDAPDDGWDDDAPDDSPAYPAAPVPAHERTWRHPSEIGQADWVTTEPPVTIGRGLLVTSGAIGSALGVAVLYLLLPAGAPSPSASPTVTSSIASVRPAVVALAEDPAVTTMLLSGTTEVGSDGPIVTLPASDTPSTVLVMAVEAPTQEPLSVAVAIEGAPYVVTTASALESIGAIDLLGPGDIEVTPRMSAELVSIEGDLAYLAPSEEMEVVSFAATATAEPGQTVTVLADDPTDVVYVDSGTAGGVAGLDAGRIIEGTPVVDDQGALVALCTVIIDGEGAHVELIPVRDPAVDPRTPSSPDDSAATDVAGEGVDDGSGNDSGSEIDVTTTTLPSTTAATSGGSVATDRPSSITTSTSVTPSTVATSASVTTTTSASTPGSGSVPASAPTAWAGLRFEGAPASAPLTVTGVVAGSPAMAAGVMIGERVMAIDGTEVATMDEVVAAIKRRHPGEVMKLTLAPRSPGAANTTGTSATTTTAAASSGSSNTGGGTGTRTISVVLAAFAPTV
jgi:PDZ domain